MEPFPFTEAEWETVRGASLNLLNATFANDSALAESFCAELFAVLGDLRLHHGEHPVLLETQADFTDDDFERAALYRRAITLAEANDIRTLSIRLSFARVLLDLDRKQAARVELLACEHELPRGDDSDRPDWAELLADTGVAQVVS